MLDDRRIRIRISDKWIRIRIREAIENMDPTDPDPQHWSDLYCIGQWSVRIRERQYGMSLRWKKTRNDRKWNSRYIILAFLTGNICSWVSPDL
jgi:hypothetical protein